MNITQARHRLGEWLYLAGYRMQSDDCRRALAAINSIGLLWLEKHPHLTQRLMAGEDMTICVTFETKVEKAA